MKTIEILIAPGGEISLITHGFAGEACRDATQALESALGLIQSDLPTAEMFAPARESVQQTG